MMILRKLKELATLGITALYWLKAIFNSMVATSMLNYSLVLVQKLDQGSLFDYFTVHDLSLDRR